MKYIYCLHMHVKCMNIHYFILESYLAEEEKEYTEMSMIVSLSHDFIYASIYIMEKS